MAKKAKHTPLIEQYFQIRAHYPDALLFFQVGDFYELFFDDAVTAANFLAITLTKRGKSEGKDIPLCGVPVHALTHYVVKLVRAGYTVAICDQVSKPMPGTVVKRAVTKVYTPGTLTDEQLLDEKTACYLSVVFPYEQSVSLLSIELLTGHVIATTCSVSDAKTCLSELSRVMPDEVVMPSAGCTAWYSLLKKAGYLVTPLREHQDQEGVSADSILEQACAEEWIGSLSAQVHEVIEKDLSLRGALEVLYRYLQKTYPAALTSVSGVSYYEPEEFVTLDPATVHNLELIKNQQGGTSHTLFSTIDRACTAMGSRVLKKWIVRPLRNKNHIVRRLDAIESFLSSPLVLEQASYIFKSLCDVERVVGRIMLSRATLNDYRRLAHSLTQMPDLHSTLQTCSSSPLIAHLLDQVPFFEKLRDLLTAALADDGADGFRIRSGFDAELDRLRGLAKNGQQLIAQLSAREAERLEIPSLKILYTNVAGYFIEVTKTHIAKVPEEYRQVATMVNRNRYVTDELKQLEHDVSHAKEQSVLRENELYESLEEFVRSYGGQLRVMARSLGQLDALYALARLAFDENYVRPSLSSDARALSIENGRHPVVAAHLSSPFIPNSTSLADPALLWIITGPNMGGKSTYLRQVALICLLGQMGSYVPAQSATLPLLDRIFTRIGAGDNVAQGKSTFLVEMEETATICSQATERSLVILDEVGRGTSTEDGRALAQAIIEYLVATVQCYTLFATHYHELTQLSEVTDAIQNYHMTCVKKGHTLHFLHTLQPGVAHASFGIDVARLADLPEVVIARARALLDQYAAHEDAPRVTSIPTPQTSETTPLSDAQREALAHIKALDLDELSPRAALDLIWNLQKRI